MDFVDGQPSVNGLLVRSVGAMQGEISDLDDLKRQVMVRFPHEKVDTYKTTFGPDCFRESFAERKPTVCWQHKLDEPIGHAADAQVTRSANEMVAQLDDFDAVPLARRAFEQIRSGTLTDWSFGFRDPTYEPHPMHRGVRRIVKAKMKEMSPVTIGSIPGAIATGTREEQQVMAEHSIDEIIRLRDAHLISPEAAADMIRQMVDPAMAAHITVIKPGNKRKAKKLDANGEDTGGDDEDLEDDAAVDNGLDNDGDGSDFEDDDDEDDDNKRGQRRAKYVVPQVINGAVVMEALPLPLQRALAENEATLWITVGDDELVPASLARSQDGAVPTIAAEIAAACTSGVEWFADVEDMAALPDGVRHAYELFKAAGTASTALVQILDPDGSARAAYTEPGDAAGAEDMDSHPVKCGECGGSGETEDGKTCPRCGGSGIEAVERAATSVPDDAPDGSKMCPTCKGKGTIMEGHRKCPDCKGKGWVSPSDQDDMQNRADSDSWSTKPWTDFSQADYTPQQWKDACLIVEGDGSTKAQCSLPVKEPDGTYNVNGIAAAAGRLNQTEAPEADKVEAANKLSDLYKTMGKDLPPEAAKLATRAPEPEPEPTDDLETQRQRALSRLGRHTRVPAGA